MSNKIPKLLVEEINYIENPSAALEGLLNDPLPFLFDSALEMDKYGRYSILGSNPKIILRTKNRLIEIIKNGELIRREGDPLEAVDQTIKSFGSLQNDDSSRIPFTGGAVGYFGYDLNRQIEKLPDIALDDQKIPDIYLSFYTEAVVIDHRDKRAFAVAYIPGDSRGDESKAKNRLNRLMKRVNAGRQARYSGANGSAAVNLASNFTRREYRRIIDKAKEYISKGDIFQVNLAQRFAADLKVDHYTLYKRLRDCNPAPFGAFLSYGDFSILSSSPERFMFMDDRYVETRPIKGTRPHYNDKTKDDLSIKELRASEKDAAEHVMIVDVKRNDLGRVCEYGSVTVPELMVVESYKAVHHLVSTVAGRLRDGVGAVDLLRASFPGGSITGAPKVRAMEIIEELEPHRRNIYTGAIGYISSNGRMDTSIAIRTITVLGNKTYLQVGGGIVADSDADAEYEETIDKARAMFHALGLVQRHT